MQQERPRLGVLMVEDRHIGIRMRVLDSWPLYDDFDVRLLQAPSVRKPHSVRIENA